MLFKLSYTLTCSVVVRKRKNVYIHTVLGALLFVIMYSISELLVYLAMVSTNFIIIWILQSRVWRTYVTLALNLAGILVGSRYGNTLGIEVGEPWGISPEIMLAIPKIYFICQRKGFSIPESLGYLLFVPSLVYGPAVPEEELDRYVSLDLRKVSERMLQLLLFACTNFYGPKHVSKLMNLTEPCNASLPAKILHLYAHTFIYRTQYYFIWTFSSLCFHLYGLNVTNLRFFKIEISPTLGQVASYWNHYIVKFLRRSCFWPLKERGNLFAAIVTGIVSGVWHGGRPCDFLFLVSFIVAVPILGHNSAIMRRRLPQKIYLLATTLQTAFFVSYIPAPFYFNSVKKSIQVWKNIYFIGHLVLLLSLLCRALSTKTAS